jgi:uncharacterized repeat protein (TIGR01451 family)/fimbrial isopeptide formation D2 family protein
MKSRGFAWSLSDRTRRGITLSWLVLFVLSILLQYGNLTNPSSALAVHDDGIFELDGNALDQAAAGDDWENGTPGAAASLFIPGSVEKDGVDTTYFAQGGSKDHHDIDEWHYSATDVAPDKDELIDVFAAAYDTADGTTVYFGADKFDDSGDAQIGFWFFQGAVSLGANGLFDGVHTVGDVLVLSDFTNGGSVDLICVYEWNPPGDNIAAGVPTNTGCDLGDNLTLAAAGAECDVSGPDGEFDVCAIVNAGVEDAPWPFVNKDGATDFGVGQFFEGGINLDELFDGDAPCFSGFLAETRSSQEVEAQLKDFALGTLNTCRPPDIETQVSDSVIDVGESVTDTADLTNNSPLPTGSIAFYLCGPEASAPDCSTGGTLISTETIVAGMATSDPFTADSVDDAGFYCFRAEYTPDAQGELNYIAGSHTNLTTECFEVQTAVIDVEKDADAASVNAGDQIGFTVTISNDGAGLATGLSFTDALPGGDGIDWSIESQSGGFSISGSPQDESLAFAPTTLAGGASAWVHVVSSTTADSCGVYDNTASVTTSNDGSDEASASTEVLCADIDVAKEADAASVNAGEQIGFTVTISNNGEGLATGLSFSDDLPGGDGVSWSIESQSGGFSITGTAPNQSLAFAPTTLAAGASAWVHIVSDTTADSCGVYDNTASVTTGNDGSDEASASTEVLCADIDVDKTADDAQVNAGDQIGFTVTLSNSGEGDATGLSFTDALPGGPGIDWTIDSQSGGFSITGTAPNQSLMYAPTELAAGAEAWVHVVSNTTADSCGVYDNTASVSTGNDGSDEASASTEVLCGAINVEKVADDAEVVAGSQIGFTVTITNSGEGDVTGLNFTDDLPGGAGVSWTIESQSGGFSITGTAPNQGLVYAPTTLAAGASAWVHIVSDTTFDSCGVYDNTAAVTTGNDGSDEASDSTSVRCPEIDLDKSHNDADGIVGQGQTVTYTLDVSVAEGPVTNAVVTDELPVGQTYVDGSQSSNPAETSFQVTADGRTLTWTYASLDDAGAVITYDVTIDADAPIGDQVNVAEVCVSEVPDCESDDELVSVPALTIDKSFTGNTAGTLIDGTPLAKVGDVLTYTLAYDLTGGPVNNGVITDTIPEGLTYVDGSATDNAEFTFVDYDDATRTLTWTAPIVSADDSVTYQVTVDADSFELPQPLVNVATIESDETPLDDDTAEVGVQQVFEETSPPTLPPTDTIDHGDQAPSNPGFGLMLALLVLAGVGLVAGYLTPTPGRTRRQEVRRR